MAAPPPPNTPPPDWTKHKNLGNVCFTKRQFEQAIKHFSDAIAVSADFPIPYSNRAASYQALGKFDLALADAERCTLSRVCFDFVLVMCQMWFWRLF